MSASKAGYPPLRVVRVIARLNVGGPARHVTGLDTALRARGYRTLLLHGDPDAGEGSLEHLVAERRLPALRVRGLGRRISPMTDVRAFAIVLRAIFEARPDIVHTHTAKAGVIGRLAALAYNVTRPRARRCLVAHTFHGNVFRGYFGGLGSAAVRTVERQLARITDRIVVISEQQRREIVDQFDVAPAPRTVVVPLGLELEPMLQLDENGPSLRSELAIPASAFVVGFVGRFVPIKDLRTLLDAVAALRAEMPAAVLVMVGDGPVRGELEARAASLGLDGAVRFLGWRFDLPALYRTMDVVVLTSRNEGTPVSLIEAMAAARPVVATDVGAVGDVIEHERTGLLVPVGDPPALAGAIRSLAADPGRRARLGRNARLAVAARYSASRLADDVDRLYREGLAARRGARS